MHFQNFPFLKKKNLFNPFFYLLFFIAAMNPDLIFFKAISYDILNSTLFWGEDKKIWAYNNGTSFLWLETDDYVYSIIVLYEECRR